MDGTKIDVNKRWERAGTLMEASLTQEGRCDRVGAKFSQSVETNGLDVFGEQRVGCFKCK